MWKEKVDSSPEFKFHAGGSLWLGTEAVCSTQANITDIMNIISLIHPSSSGVSITMSQDFLPKCFLSVDFFFFPLSIIPSLLLVHHLWEASLGHWHTGLVFPWVPGCSWWHPGHPHSLSCWPGHKSPRAWKQLPKRVWFKWLLAWNWNSLSPLSPFSVSTSQPSH